MRKSSQLPGHYIYLSFVILLLCVSVWSVYGIFMEKETQEELSISVILDENNNVRWNAFQLGLERAAKDFNIDLNIVPTARFESDKELLDLVEQRVQDKTNGIILTPYGSDGFLDLIDIVSYDIRTAFVESDVLDSEATIYPKLTIAPDYNEIGKTLVEDILEDYDGNLDNRKIYILTSKPEQLGINTAISYIRFALHDQKCLFQNIIDTSKDEDKNWSKNIQSDLVIAMDDYSLSLAAKTLSGKKRNTIALYGIGLSENNVYYLDHNVIQGMIVVNEYKMGYESLSLLAENIRTHNPEERNITIDFQNARPDNIHQPEMEKLLFPNIQ